MIKEGIILVLSCLGIAQAIFLCAYLFTLREKKANLLLSLIVLALTIRIGKSVLHYYLHLPDWVRNMGISAMLVTGPLLLFYGQSLLQKEDVLNRKNSLHLIPFILFFLLGPIIPNNGNAASLIAYFLVLVHFAIYIAGAWLMVNRFGLEGKRDLVKWYKNIVIGISIVWFFYTGVFIGFIPFYILVAITFSLLVYIFSYLLLKRHVFALEKYAGSALDNGASRKLLVQLKELFNKEELFLSPDISLKTVAEKLGVNPREVSQVINEVEQKNFAEFINHYRIEKAKSLINNPKNQNEKLSTIAYDCGFGNVTSFNVAFKAITQLTPSQYRSQLIPA